uniref:DUF4704 domain-containing protein n=1 Tax=Macrostomum lignano TaxID=282301 RepID=A0A1I8FLF8_9PLAT
WLPTYTFRRFGGHVTTVDILLNAGAEYANSRGFLGVSRSGFARSTVAAPSLRRKGGGMCGRGYSMGRFVHCSDGGAIDVEICRCPKSGSAAVLMIAGRAFTGGSIAAFAPGPDFGTAEIWPNCWRLLAFDCGFQYSGSLADCLAGLRLRCRRIREGQGAWAVGRLDAYGPVARFPFRRRQSLLCNALLSMEQADCTPAVWLLLLKNLLIKTLSALEGTRPRAPGAITCSGSALIRIIRTKFSIQFETICRRSNCWSIDPGDSAEFALSKRLAACLTLASLVERCVVFVNEELPSALAKATSGGGGGGGGGGGRRRELIRQLRRLWLQRRLLETFATVLTALDNASCRQADDGKAWPIRADLALCLGGGDQLRLAANQAIVSLLNAIKRRPDDGLAEQLLNYLCDQLPAPGSERATAKAADASISQQCLPDQPDRADVRLSTLTSPNLPVRSLYSAIGPTLCCTARKLSPSPLLVRRRNGFRDKRYSGSEAESLALFKLLGPARTRQASRTPGLPGPAAAAPVSTCWPPATLPLHDAAVMAQQPAALGPAASAAVHCQAHAYFYAYSPFCADSRTIGESTLSPPLPASEEVDLSVRLQQLLGSALGALLASPGCPPKSAACAVPGLTELAAAPLRCAGTGAFATTLMLAGGAVAPAAVGARLSVCAVRLMAACLSGAAAATSGDLGLVTSSIGTRLKIYMRCLMTAATLAKQSRCLDDDVGQDAQGSSDLRGQWLGLRHHMMRTCEVTFSGPNLRLVLKYLLDGANDRLFSTACSCPALPRRQGGQTGRGVARFSLLCFGQSRHVLSFQWFWATWEVSWFCVLNKLKVPPWNRAQDTFLAIEDALNRLVNQRLSANPSDWHRGYCVLLFMEQLEKLVFNAYEGCAILSGLSHFKSVKYFFRTNKSTCLEWFHRTRPIVMQLCDRLDSPETEWANKLTVCTACTLGARLGWGGRLLCVRAAAERADGKLESALQLYEQHLQDLLMNGIGRPGEVRL